MKDICPWRWRMLALIVLLQIVTFSVRSFAELAKPDEVVRKLYREVVARRPMGIPNGADRTAIWPLLSKRLIKAFETRNACDLDWVRRHRRANPPLKAPGVYEIGLFSGSNERGFEVDGAEVGSIKVQPDRSYLVEVKLWSNQSGGDKWQVAARVISEDGRFVVDDIFGFKGVFDYDKSVYMSSFLGLGCKGTHSTFD